MERLKILRKEAKISQYDLADIFGVAQNTVSQWEKGVRRPDFEMLEKISIYFNVSIDWLIGKSDIRMYGEMMFQKDIEHFQSIFDDCSISDEAKHIISCSLGCLYLLCFYKAKDNEIDFLIKIRLILENILKIGHRKIIIEEQPTIHYLKEFDDIKNEIIDCLEYINEFNIRKKIDIVEILDMLERENS